jgi:site-specific DNA-methyltransferase (adenine-specific)
MQPYYEANGITIFHADCRDVLPHIHADVLLTDPPYGLAHSSNRTSALYGATDDYYGDGSIANDLDTSMRDFVLQWAGERPALVFGSWKVQRPANVRALLIWDKGEASGMGDLSIPWKPSHEEIYVIGKGFSGARTTGVLRAYVPARISFGRVHPNEKPVSLLQMLLGKCPAGVIVDPFMGSGRTLRAGKNLGRRAIGIEIEERYCEIAARRLQQEVMDFADA